MARATMADVIAERDAARAELADLRARVTVLEVTARLVRQACEAALEPVTPGTPVDGPVPGLAALHEHTRLHEHDADEAS